MSFWRSFGFNTVSALDTLLEREDFTLEQVLDEEDLLQELKTHNKRLIQFLSQPAILGRLIDYIIIEPEENDDPRKKFKYPFLACEILCSEIWLFSERIYENEELLDKIYSFLDKDPPLNVMRTAYITRVAAVLLHRKITETLLYLRQKEKVVDRFVKHSINSSVMDLLLKIISTEETREGRGITNWLRDENLIPQLVSKLDPSQPNEVHETTAQVLVDIIVVSSNQRSILDDDDEPEEQVKEPKKSPLIAQLEGKETITQLLQYMFADGGSSTLIHGLSVLNEIFKANIQSENNFEHYDQLPELFQVFSHYFENFVNLLKNPPLTEAQQLTSTSVEDSVGFPRLKIIEMILSILRLNYPIFKEYFKKTEIFKIIFKLFFQFDKNNFLHGLVEQMIVVVLTSNDNELKMMMIEDGELVEQLLLGISENRKEIEKTDKPSQGRKSYMGYVTIISNHLLSESNKNHDLQLKLTENSEWNQYVENELQETKQLENRSFGGQRPFDGNSNGGYGNDSFNLLERNHEEEEEDDETADTSAQAVFTQYLAQQGFSGTYQDVEEDDYDDDDEYETFDADRDFDSKVVINTDESDMKFKLVDDDDEQDPSDDEESEN